MGINQKNMDLDHSITDGDAPSYSPDRPGDNAQIKKQVQL